MRLYRTHHHNIEILEKVTIKQLGTEITLDEAVKTILNKGNAFGYSEFFLNFIRTNINDIIK